MNFLLQISDFLATRYLAYRGSRHLQSGCPPIALFAFDHIGYEINVKGRFEGADLEKTFEFLRESNLTQGTAVDVGANIGNHSLYFSDHFEHVVSLEPNPRVFELLCINAKLRSNIQPLGFAASDMSGEMMLSFDPANWGGGQLGVGQRGQSSTVSVPVTMLDELKELSACRVGLVKIDVEGHELRVLKGAIKLLARSHPVILFEQRPDDISDGSSAVVDWLREHGYTRFHEIRSSPGLPKGWTFRGRKLVNGLLRLVAGERKRVAAIRRFENAFYPMIIALPAP